MTVKKLELDLYGLNQNNFIKMMIPYSLMFLIYIYIIFKNVRNVIKLITNFSHDHIKVM